jgi:hypothetical protein
MLNFPGFQISIAEPLRGGVQLSGIVELSYSGNYLFFILAINGPKETFLVFSESS